MDGSLRFSDFDVQQPEQALKLERLQQKGRRTLFDGPDREVAVCSLNHRDNRKLSVGRPDEAKRSHLVHDREIKQDEVRLHVLQQHKSLTSVPYDHGLIAAGRKPISEPQGTSLVLVY